MENEKQKHKKYKQTVEYIYKIKPEVVLLFRGFYKNLYFKKLTYTKWRKPYPWLKFMYAHI